MINLESLWITLTAPVFPWAVKPLTFLIITLYRTEILLFIPDKGNSLRTAAAIITIPTNAAFSSHCSKSSAFWISSLLTVSLLLLAFWAPAGLGWPLLGPRCWEAPSLFQSWPDFCHFHCQKPPTFCPAASPLPQWKDYDTKQDPSYIFTPGRK